MILGAALRSTALVLLFVSVPASASAGAGTKTAAVNPAASLSVSPSRVQLVPGVHGTIRVTNSGNRRVVVVAGPAGYALDLRGRPQIVGRAHGAASWLVLRPSRFALAPGATAQVGVTAAAPHRVPPGDHPALILFEARSAGTTRVAVALRVGIVVEIRAAGVVVRRIDIRAVRVRRTTRARSAVSRRTLELALANRGNVSELVTPRRISLVLLRRGRVIATLRPAPQTLLPRTAGLVDVRYRGAVRGPVTAIVTLTAPNGGAAERRRFSLRL
jgi:hypothetical protein